MLCIDLVKSLQKAFCIVLKSRGFLLVQRATLAARQRPVASLLYKTLAKNTLWSRAKVSFTQRKAFSVLSSSLNVEMP